MLTAQKYFYEIARAKMSASASAGGKTAFLGKKERQAAGLSQKQANSRLSKAKSDEDKVKVIQGIKQGVKELAKTNSKPSTTPSKNQQKAATKAQSEAQVKSNPRYKNLNKREVAQVAGMERRKANEVVKTRNQYAKDMMSRGIDKKTAEATAQRVVTPKYLKDMPVFKNSAKEQKAIVSKANQRAFNKELDALP